eukprot:TRINITY_DN166_c0_g2_i1.p2 TRINITY_DN166_c0_g2~~TRINITY_DN166_c0_g2_i1.p2  ORF type:complete len:174 (+),score=80.29 TRINITY_DN166_c0_g2_i1:91-612(+)
MASAVTRTSSFGKDSEDQMRAQVRDAFKLFDADGSGAIDLEEMKLAMKGLGYENVPHEEIVQMLRAVDKDGNDTVEENEFVDMMMSKMHSRDTPEEIATAYRLFCKFGNADRMTADCLRGVAKKLGESVNDVIFDEFITAAKEDCEKDAIPSEDADALSMMEWQFVMGKCKGK